MVERPEPALHAAFHVVQRIDPLRLFGEVHYLVVINRQVVELIRVIERRMPDEGMVLLRFQAAGMVDPGELALFRRAEFLRRFRGADREVFPALGTAGPRPPDLEERLVANRFLLTPEHGHGIEAVEPHVRGLSIRRGEDGGREVDVLDEAGGMPSSGDRPG